MPSKDDYERALAEAERIIGALKREVDEAAEACAQAAAQIYEAKALVERYELILRKTRNALAHRRPDIAAFFLNEVLGLNS
jgi:23S rRNA maturation mini-RNase III